MDSYKSALLSAIIGTALLVVAFGLIVAFVPKGKPPVKAQGNLPIVAGVSMLSYSGLQLPLRPDARPGLVFNYSPPPFASMYRHPK